MKRIYFIIFSILITGTMFFLSFGCGTPEHPRAVITVVEEDGSPVNEAQVVVKAPDIEGKSTVVYLLERDRPIADTQWTDRDGRIRYDFRYEAIYQIQVWKGSDRNHPFARRGRGVLILENDKTYQTTVTINEQTTF